MFPGYRNRDPYIQPFPNPREPSPSQYHYNPNWEPRSHVKLDSFKHPPAFEPWPYSGTTEHNCCYNHSYPPGYYDTRPPYFHYHPPPQMYYPGPYPPYPDSYPPYFIPPHYAADHARFDHDKERYHCCGCPNHVCHGQDGSSLRIVEETASPKIGDKSTLKIVEEPEKGSKDSYNSLTRFPGSHYPIQWLPCNPTGEEKAEKITQSPPILPGLHKNTSQGDKKFTQLPYPIYWFPDSEKPEVPVKDRKEIDATPKSVEDWPLRFRRSPMKLLGNVNSEEKSNAIEGDPKVQNSLDRTAEKERKIKTIPVVHIESRNEKQTMPDTSEEKDKPKKFVDGEMHNNPSVKKDSSQKKPSHPKTPKLPPVCLRVDPIPKKKGSNMKAQSSSHPSHEEKGMVNKNSNDQVAIINNVADNMTPPKVIEVIDVKDKQSVEGAIINNVSEKCGQEDKKKAVVNGDVGGSSVQKDDFSISQQPEVEQDEEKVDSSENKAEIKNVVKTNLSPEEAALIIQSAYRGFSVRRWKPLEKRRKIELIRGKVAAVKNQIQNYEDSSERDMKQKVVISETIMDLLLQLDTIQGLLPDMRETRKSVARELVFLQDKLDKLYDQAINGLQECLTSPVSENVCPANTSNMNENSVIEQPSPSSKENIFVQEIEASPMASEEKPASALEQDEVKEKVDVLPRTEDDQGTLDKDENDRQVDNLLTIPGEVGMLENSTSDVAASHPHEGEAASSVLKQRSEEDDEAEEDDDGNDGHEDVSIACDTREVSTGEKSVSRDAVLHPSEGEVANFVLKHQHEKGDDSNVELLIPEVKFDPKPDAEEVLAVKPDEENREPLIVGSLSGEDTKGSEENVSIKAEELIGEEAQTVLSVNDQIEKDQSTEEAAALGETGDSQNQSEMASVIPADETCVVEDNHSGETIECGDGNERPVSPGAAVCGSGSEHEKFYDEVNIKEKKVMEENAELRQMLKRLLSAGEEQMGVISDLNHRVRSLERQLSRKKKVKSNHGKGSKPSRSPLSKNGGLSCEGGVSSTAA